MRYAISLAALLWCAAARGDTFDIPDTPAGRFFKTFLTAYNSADPVQIERYNTLYKGTLPPKAWIERHADTGDLRPVRIEQSEPNRLTLLLSTTETDDFYREVVEMDPADPMRKVVFSQASAERPVEFAIPRLSRSGVTGALDRRAAELVAAGKFTGTMMVEHGGKILTQRAWGVADRSRNIPVTLDTKFRIGSDSKMFTAIAVLQLVEAGKLSLDGTVGKYLPDYPSSAFAREVTIRQLLTHTGGAGDIFGPEFDAHQAELRTNADYVKLFGARDPDHSEQGQKAYSNYGFVLLGHIVEHVSGEDYYDYVRRHVFEPAGMTSTGSLPENESVPLRAPGYTHDGDKLVDNASTLPYRGMAAGGGYSTAGDLIRFARALQAGKLISKAMLEQATRAQNPDRWYGLGFEIHGEGAAAYWGHGGGAPGMNAAFRVYPASDTVIVALSNIDPPGADLLADFYANRMPAN